MTAQYWTTDGSDIWRLNERRIFNFENLDTKEVVSCECVADITDKNFTPVVMPDVKSTKTPKVKKTARSSRRGPRAKSNYKGVSPSKTPGKFRVQFYDKKNKKNIGLGTFNSELLAAAAYQERAGNFKDARRLRNEHEEGDPPLAERPSEE